MEKNFAVVYRIKELFPIIMIDKAVMEIFSEIKVHLQTTGSPADDMDLLIASTSPDDQLHIGDKQRETFRSDKRD